MLLGRTANGLYWMNRYIERTENMARLIDAGLRMALTRSQLLADAWGYDYIGESRTVDVHINRVRRKLGLQHEIQTVFKVGYRLNTRGTL